MPSEHYDGSYDSAFAIAPAIRTFPMAEHGDIVTRSVTQRFQVRTSKYTPAALGSRYPYPLRIPNADSLKCVGDSNISYIDGEIMEFTREWCDVPKQWNDCEQFIYKFMVPFSFTSVVEGQGNGLYPMTLTINSILRKTYVHTATPGGIKINLPYKIMVVPGENIFDATNYKETGTKYVDSKGKVLLLAEASQPRRWRGLIWEVTERCVKDISDSISTPLDDLPDWIG